MSETEGFDLSEVLADLRRQMTAAAVAGKDEDLRFEVSSVRVDLSVALERVRTGKGGIKLWVLEAGAESARSRAASHTISIELCPVSTASGAKPWVAGAAHDDEE